MTPTARSVAAGACAAAEGAAAAVVPGLRRPPSVLGVSASTEGVPCAQARPSQAEASALPRGCLCECPSSPQSHASEPAEKKWVTDATSDMVLSRPGHCRLLESWLLTQASCASCDTLPARHPHVHTPIIHERITLPAEAVCNLPSRNWTFTLSGKKVFSVPQCQVA